MNLSKVLRNFQIVRKSLTTTVQPVRLSYASYESTDSSGRNPVPLVLTHGLFGSKSNFNSLCKAYQSKTRRKVVAVDARNHGDSPHTDQHTYDLMVADFRELFDAFKFERVCFLGHSMGGRTGMYLALKYPKLVDKLIVVDISPVTRKGSLRTVSALFTVLQKIRLPKGVTSSVARRDAALQLSQFIHDERLRGFILTNLIQKLDGSYGWRVNLPILVANFHEVEIFPPVNGLKFEGPTLFVGGQKSSFIPESEHTQILQMFPKAEFKYIEGAGHWVHSEKHEEFLQCTVEFLNKD